MASNGFCVKKKFLLLLTLNHDWIMGVLFLSLFSQNVFLFLSFPFLIVDWMQKHIFNLGNTSKTIYKNKPNVWRLLPAGILPIPFPLKAKKAITHREKSLMRLSVKVLHTIPLFN